jgi:hypothetical protein
MEQRGTAASDSATTGSRTTRPWRSKRSTKTSAFPSSPCCPAPRTWSSPEAPCWRPRLPGRSATTSAAYWSSTTWRRGRCGSFRCPITWGSMVRILRSSPRLPALTQVKVRRAVVDAAISNRRSGRGTRLRSPSTPMCVVPVNELPGVGEPATGYTISWTPPHPDDTIRRIPTQDRQGDLAPAPPRQQATPDVVFHAWRTVAG